MAVIETHRPAAPRGMIIAEMAQRAARAVFDWHNRRQTRKALSRLSLRELDDIGLTPGDIETL